MFCYSIDYKFKEDRMREISIQFKGLNPLPSTKQKMESTFEALQFLLPPENTIKLVIKKYPKNFEGTVTVHSSMGDFTVSEKHKELMPLMKALKNTLKNQILKFRDSRLEVRKAG